MNMHLDAFVDSGLLFCLYLTFKRSCSKNEQNYNENLTKHHFSLLGAFSPAICELIVYQKEMSIITFTFEFHFPFPFVLMQPHAPPHTVHQSPYNRMCPSLSSSPFPFHCSLFSFHFTFPYFPFSLSISFVFTFPFYKFHSLSPLF